MDIVGTSPWVYVVIVGIAVLGIAIAYGMMRNKNRTAAERAASEAGTHAVYEREDRRA